MEPTLDDMFLMERARDKQGIPVVRVVFCCETCLVEYEEMFPHHFDLQTHECTELGCVLFLGTLH